MDSLAAALEAFWAGPDVTLDLTGTTVSENEAEVEPGRQGHCSTATLDAGGSDRFSV